MTAFFLSLARALIRTLLIEAAVVLLLTKNKGFLKGSLICNILTNPLLNLLLVFPLHYFGQTVYVICAVTGEICVFVGEAYLYRLFTRAAIKKCVIVSLAANAASLGAGLLFNII